MVKFEESYLEPIPCNTAVPQMAEEQAQLKKHKQVVEKSSGVKIAPLANLHEGETINRKRKSNDIYVDKNRGDATQRPILRDCDTEAPRPNSGQLSRSSNSAVWKHVSNALNLRSPHQKDANVTHVLKAINDKYGDITQNSLLKNSEYLKALVLNAICTVVQDLQSKRLEDVDIELVLSYYAIVGESEELNVNVQWLKNRMDEIIAAVTMRDSSGEWNRCKASIVEMKEAIAVEKLELDKLGSKIRLMEDELAEEISMGKVMKSCLARCARKLKISQLHQYSSLMEGLI